MKALDTLLQRKSILYLEIFLPMYQNIIHVTETNLFCLQKCCSEQWPFLHHLCAMSEKVETMPLLRLPLAVITIGALLIIAIFNLVSNRIIFILWTYCNIHSLSNFLYSFHHVPCFLLLFSNIWFAAWVDLQKDYAQCHVQKHEKYKLPVCRTKSTYDRFEF